MEQNILVSTVVPASNSNLLAALQPVKHSKLFLYSILSGAFEVVLELLDDLLDLKDWRDIIYLPNVLVMVIIVYVAEVQENHRAMFLKQNPTTSTSLETADLDPSVVLIQKINIIPFVLSEAAYGAVVGALHSLPDQVQSWEDLMDVATGLLQSLRTFVSLALKSYKAWLTRRNFASTLLDRNASQISTALEVVVSDVLEAAESLPDEIPHRLGMINAFKSFWQYICCPYTPQTPHDSHRWSVITYQAKSFFSRTHEVFCHPRQFANMFLDFCSLVHSFWDGTHSRPEVILPTSSLVKRPSSRLSRLLLQHSKDVPWHECGEDISSSKSSYPWIVAVIDVNADLPCGVGADVYGITAMLFLVEILTFLLGPSWMAFFVLSLKIIFTCSFMVTLGDGTLTLLPPSGVHHTSTAACGLLLDEEFSVILRGTQNLVEAITLGGFHFTYLMADFLPTPIWKIGITLALEGHFQGLLYLMIILPAWRFIHPAFTSTRSQLLVTFIFIRLFALVTSWESLWRTATRIWFDNDLLKGTVHCFMEVTAELVRMAARGAPITVSWFLYIHDYSVFNELQLLMDPIPLLSLAFIMSVSSHDYPIRTAKFLRTLGDPPVKKWQFKTPAAAATFQCLVLCHGAGRPVGNIDVRGLLETLIPDQRDIWMAWKARVADRISHELRDISFAPTLPTFRNAERQKQFKAHLDQAQYAYEEYCRVYLND